MRRPNFGSAALILSSLALAATAQTAVRDDFESGDLAPAWEHTAGAAVQTGAGAGGTARYAALAPTNHLGARFDAVAAGGANDFFIDCYLRVTNTVQRQFNLMVSDSTNSTGSSAATVNLRHQSNAWFAFSTTWNAIPGLPGVTPGAWHRLRLTGTNWGGAGASYQVELSDAGGTNFSSSVANLTWFQGGNPSNTTAHFFAFTTVFGNSPGFDVDEVEARVTRAPFVPPAEPDAVLNISGVYPHLAVFSAEDEVGIGAVVPWADRLWFVTYPPHKPNGSADKLWTIDTNLVLAARPESVGGTHANRLIHRESQQLVIGPYFIDATAQVRRVPPASMPGRLTATARHLIDPSNKVYFATMEEGFYEVDVNTLAVTTLKADAQTQTSGAGLLMPGNHGKGCYAGQGRLVYANNGETGWAPGADLSGFNLPAGLLAENAGVDFSNGWTTVERRNFTEVTGPGGIHGATDDRDPIWSLGWDKRSVILKLLEGGSWQSFRLPKGSYTHDSFQGWYTEWPRIREVTPGTLLMHMHGLFYLFPKTFSAVNTAGISPICTHLKMPVDYCGWEGRIVMGRDDAAKAGGNVWAGQSHSAPWFGQIDDMRAWGAPAGFGGVWKDDAVTAGTPSEPFLVAGFERGVLHLRQGTHETVDFLLECDRTGDGAWSNFASVSVASNGYAWFVLPCNLDACWVRLTPDRDATNVTAFFHLSNPPRRPEPALFSGLADAGADVPRSDGILRPREGDATTLQFAARRLDDTGAVAGLGYYEIGGPFQLRATNNAAAEAALRGTYSLSNAAFTVDAASVVYIEGTNRFRLPRSQTAYDSAFAGAWPRGRREVVTERQIFHAHGTFYELPYAGSGGFRRIRPVATHAKCISDFASWRGLFVMAGVAAGATNDGHVFRADDGQAALWFGDVDDLWRMGAPSGVGGPWKDSAVTAGAPSDPYLMFGYERKVVELSHAGASPVTFTVEVDFAADNTWSEYARFVVPPGQTVAHAFPEGYSAHWIRLRTDADAVASAIFTYGPSDSEIAGIERVPEGGSRLSLRVGTGPDYSVQGSTNLVAWELLASGPLPAQQPFVWTDLDADDLPARFYRALPAP